MLQAFSSNSVWWSDVFILLLVSPTFTWTSTHKKCVDLHIASSLPITWCKRRLFPSSHMTALWHTYSTHTSSKPLLSSIFSEFSKQHSELWSSWNFPEESQTIIGTQKQTQTLAWKTQKAHKPHQVLNSGQILIFANDCAAPTVKWWM